VTANKLLVASVLSFILASCAWQSTVNDLAAQLERERAAAITERFNLDERELNHVRDREEVLEDASVASGPGPLRRVVRPRCR